MIIVSSSNLSLLLILNKYTITRIKNIKKRKIALIKIQNYYDLEFQDAITNFDKNKSIKIDYSNINTLEVIKKNKSYYDNFFQK
tara:strand:+ start:388 stop:639 length:252 start_codon:yes stop_codon:yes gene_type:complete